MPELPEVEIGKRLAEKHLKGKKIETVIVNGNGDEIVFCGLKPDKLIENLKDKTVIDCFRKGKYIWMELDKQPHVSFHFGMTGAFWIKGHMSPKYVNLKYDSDVWPPKFSKFQLILDDGTEFAFTNIRRLGRVQFSIDPPNSPPISELGYDALNDNIEDSKFVEIYKNIERPIKAALLDQSLISGMGNWIADEILYQCNVHPSTQCRALKESDLINMKLKMTYIIITACEANGDMSKFPKDWLVHYRWGKGAKKPTQDFYGRSINFILVAGRSSAFVTNSSTSKQSKTIEKKSDYPKAEKHTLEDIHKNEENNDIKVTKSKIKGIKSTISNGRRLPRFGTTKRFSTKSINEMIGSRVDIKERVRVSKKIPIKSTLVNHSPARLSQKLTKIRKPRVKTKLNEKSINHNKSKSIKKKIELNKKQIQPADPPRRTSQRVASQKLKKQLEENVHF